MKTRILSWLTVAGILTLAPAARAHPHPGMNDTTFVRPVPPPGAGPLLWSLGGTLIPQAAGIALLDSQDPRAVSTGLALIVSSVSIGPALGYHAGGRGDRATLGVALRGGVLVTALAVAYGGRDHGRADPLHDLPAALAAGYAVAGVSAAVDIISLRARLSEPQGPWLDVVPGRSPSSGATWFALRLRF